MNIMKIIDLLIKIANNEKLPKKIIYRDNIWELIKYKEDDGKIYYNYRTEFDDGFMIYLFNDAILRIQCCLNDEIEVLEEPMKIEKLEPIYKIEQDMNLDSVIAWQKVNNRIFQKKIDEIIDYINKEDNNEKNN